MISRHGPLGRPEPSERSSRTSVTVSVGLGEAPPANLSMISPYGDADGVFGVCGGDVSRRIGGCPPTRTNRLAECDGANG